MFMIKEQGKKLKGKEYAESFSFFAKYTPMYTHLALINARASSKRPFMLFWRTFANKP